VTPPPVNARPRPDNWPEVAQALNQRSHVARAMDGKGQRTLRAIRPGAVIRDRYQERLDAELRAMQASMVRAVLAQYRRDAPELAQDASPARELKKLLRKRGRLWRARFRELAPKLGEYFATKVQERVDGDLERMLREHGLTIRFRMTRGLNDVMQATIAEQVNLITGLADEQLKRMEGAVMRSVQVGRDLEQLTQELNDSFGIAGRRAALIARDQNNKATATLARTRHLELGIVEAKWLHSAGGKKPRPEHVKFSGETYKLAQGAFLEGKWTHPGVEINCRCVSVPVLPELIP